ncbi:MAG: hypothetical protein D3906_14050 [Candidatus Electrothrix sp. AUS1_2]|nr:hypothetical protein [Candidatus Electrothrix sp. AUS1_2]
MKSGGDAEQFLWRLYLDSCLNGPPPGKIRSSGQKYSAEQSLYWLRCMAGKMTAERIVELRVEELQPHWLHQPRKFNAIYILIIGLIVCGYLTKLVWGVIEPSAGIIYGVSMYLSCISSLLILIISKLAGYIAFGLSFFLLLFYGEIYRNTLTYWMSGGIVSGLAFGVLTVSFCRRSIGTIGKITCLNFPNTFQKLKKFTKGVSIGIGYGVIYAFFGMLILYYTWEENLTDAMFGGLTEGIPGGLIAGLAFGFRKIENPIVESISPGQLISYILRDSILFTIIITLSCLIILPFYVDVQHIITSSYYYDICLALFIICFFFLGADIIVGIYTLRLLLWQEGQLPFRLVSWLEDLHQRKLLQRVGGSYHFIHKRLQEYLAQSNDANMNIGTRQ